MRTNKFIPFIIAVAIHAVPLTYFAVKRSSSTSSPFPSMPVHGGIDLNNFSLAKKTPSQKKASTKKPIESVGFNPTDKSSENNPNMAPSKGEGPSNGHQKDGANEGNDHGSTITFLKIKEPDYPPMARARGLEGKVKIKAYYNREGTVERIEITQSSGAKILDESVKKTVADWQLSKGSEGSFEKTFEFKLQN
ncbi:MAG: energy transducer TonB [Bacteriovorax sp.]